jgi:hypothetical protein
MYRCPVCNGDPHYSVDCDRCDRKGRVPLKPQYIKLSAEDIAICLKEKFKDIAMFNNQRLLGGVCLSVADRWQDNAGEISAQIEVLDL